MRKKSDVKSTEKPAAKKPAAKKKATEPGVFDVAKPGKTAPSNSGRPVIVGHKPMVSDPMVKEVDPANASEPEAKAIEQANEDLKKKLSSRKPRLVITPSSAKDKEVAVPTPGDTITAASTEEEKPADSEIKPEETAESVNFDELELDKKDAPKEGSNIPEIVKDAPAAEDEVEEKIAAAKLGVKEKPAEPEPAADTTEETPKEPETPAEEKPADIPLKGVEQPEEAPESNEPGKDNGIVDELAKQAADKKQQKVQDKQMSVYAEKIESLITQKAYFLPTSQVTRRKKRALVLVILLLVLAAVGLNFALDAEILDIGVQPLTNLL